MRAPDGLRADRPVTDAARTPDRGAPARPAGRPPAPTPAVAAAVLVALVTWLALAGAASAQVGSCGTNGCVLDMSPTIYVINNEWGNTGVGSGSITVGSQTSWSTSWDYAPSSDWTVISYPSAVLGWQWGYRLANTGFPVQLASHTPVGTTVAFRVVPDPTCAPGGVGGGGTGSRVCRMDVSYDLWLHDTSSAGTSTPIYEVMIWLAYSREMFSGTTPNAYATLGGHSWKVLLTQGGSSPVASFLLNEAADLTGATLNITDFTDWLVANQWVPGSWWLDSVQFGTEILKGKGVLTVTNYTATVGSAGGATSSGTTTGDVAINAGGAAVSPFVADTAFAGGTPATNWTGAIDTSRVANPAPQAVYQSERYGTMTYTVPGLAPGASYDVRLHFAENYFTAAGQRAFDVAINGTRVLGAFDILATTGAPHVATVQEFVVGADGAGRIVIAFTDVVNHALVNGIQVLAAAGSPPAPAPAIGFTVGPTAASPNPVARRHWLTVGTSVTAAAAASGIVVDLELYNAAGTRVAQQVYGGQGFTAGQSRSYSWRWRVPGSLAPGTYTVKVGVYDATASTVYSWVDRAATVQVQ